MSIPKMAKECCFNCYYFWYKLSSCHDNKTDRQLMWEKCNDYKPDDCKE